MLHKMKKSPLATNLKSVSVPFLGAKAQTRSKKGKFISDEEFSEKLEIIKQKLEEGFSGEVEKLANQMIKTFDLSLEQIAKLHIKLSAALEMLGRYKESLEILQDYENDENLVEITEASATEIWIQLAISYNNTGDQPKAIALLNATLQVAEAADFRILLGKSYNALSRVYRKLHEYPIARDNAEKGLKYHRENGDWYGMADSNAVIAATFYEEGNHEKAIEIYQQSIKIIGNRKSSFLLGRIYSDMSGVYNVMHLSQEGIACLEKSIQFFEGSEHKINATIAYNNLGVNLMHLGDWTKAQDAMKRSLALAFETNHVHAAGILDSFGELKLLRGEFDEAQKNLERAITIAEEKNRDWYAIQALRNLGRVFLFQNKNDLAISTSLETIARCKKIGETSFASLAHSVLAEAYLQDKNFIECEKELTFLEDSEATNDFIILAFVQRIRGLLCLAKDDRELAIYHFNRSLSIFETINDLYYIALVNYETGKIIATDDAEKASKYLTKSVEIFQRLGVPKLIEKSTQAFEKSKQVEITAKTEVVPRRPVSAVSQLLTMRLAEAVASRQLLLRELVAILQQESKAKKILIAQRNEEKKVSPYITHNYTPAESLEIVEKIRLADAQGDLDNLGKEKNLSIFNLRSPNAPNAFLVVYPRSGANLLDGSSIKPLLRIVELGMDVCALREKDKSQQSEQETYLVNPQSVLPGFIHSSPAMTALVEEVYKIRNSDVTVLVTGESGTGKELVSRGIHALSSRKDRVFIPFNCTAVPKELAEGQLFGYRKGAFTGAVNDHEGVIRSANNGTLFLDEIGDLPIEVQPKLLRFLQEGEIQPLGEKRPINVDVRVIAATNVSLEEKVEQGIFREDLYYRLNVIRLRVPPLRERRSEVPPMVNYYLNHYSAKFGKRDITITPQTVDLLMVCEWEGNVRQLCNEVQRVVARAEDGEVITPNHLSPELKRNAVPIALSGNGNVTPIRAYGNSFNIEAGNGTLEDAVSDLEKRMISQSMQSHNGNISRVARELGLTRRGLYLKLDRYGIEKAS